jgi:protein ImuB
MQLELGAATAVARRRAAPRVLALCVPDLALQRIFRAREAASGAGARRRSPVVVEREGVVLACDVEARARGIRPGDALVQARAACAELTAVPADDAADRAALEGLAEALLAIAPAVEIAWPDALLLDASGAHLLAEGGEADAEAALAARAVAMASDLGLRCRAAMANGRAPARALARHAHAAPPVAPGAEAAALAPLPISALELPPPVAGRIAALGLRQVRDLAQLPAETLAHRFGAAGLAAWRLAQGDDPSPLVPHVPERLPEERLELEAPVESTEPLLFGLKRLCDRLAARLAGRGLGATRLALALALDPSGREELEIALASPSSAASRWLVVLRERLGTLRLPAAVSAAALRVAEAAPAPGEQLAIGDRPEQLVALETVLARLAARLGEGALFAAEEADRHRPEAAYQARAFAGARRGGRKVGSRASPACSSRKRGRAKSGPAKEPTKDEGAEAEAGAPLSALVRPTRLLPRPQPLIALGEGGRVAALRVGGRTLRVLSLSPAERLAGEWWGDPFDRDYHRARIEGLGDCWIFRDAGDGRLWLHGFFD